MSTLPRPLKWPPIFPLDKGLVAWYPFDDRSGAVLRDRSGKKNHGTLSDTAVSPIWVAGRRGSALLFNGSTGYVEVVDAASLDITTELTLSVLMKVNVLGAFGGFIGKQTGVTGYDFYIRNDNLVRCRIFDGVSTLGINSVSTIVAGAWYSVIGVFDGLRLYIYLNGVLDNQLDTVATIAVNDVNPQIGRTQAVGTLAGVIALARIYDRALNAAEAKRLAESELMLVRH